MKVAWVSSWDRKCGIADYSRSLWPRVQAALNYAGHPGELVSLDEFPSHHALIQRFREIHPDLIHFQHEYGIWGGKNPPFYWFPKLIRTLRRMFPQVRCVATAHTVLPPDYRFPLQGREAEIPLRSIANLFFLKYLQKVWGRETWSGLDGVIVHSRFQVDSLLQAGAKCIEVIPHFVPALRVPGTITRESSVSGPMLPELAILPGEQPVIVVFGFFTPEKGQDIAITALQHLVLQHPSVSLVLAGGVRRKQDQIYYQRCLAQIQALDLTEHVILTGFVEERYLSSLYARAQLILAPFRETSGSGSLAHALAQGAAILASSLPLNQEINEREPGTLALFRSEDPQDCAQQIQILLKDESQRQALRAAAKRYALTHSPDVIAKRHLEFYGGRGFG